MDIDAFSGRTTIKFVTVKAEPWSLTIVRCQLSVANFFDAHGAIDLDYTGGKYEAVGHYEAMEVIGDIQWEIVDTGHIS